MLHTKYQGSMHCSFRSDFKKMFSLHKPNSKRDNPGVLARITLVNVYVDLVVFTRIAGTS